MRYVWSLFDGSGIMGLPWAERGYHVLCFNSSGADHGLYDKVRVVHPLVHYVDKWLTPNELPFTTSRQPDIIFAFPPCTDLAVSGAAHFQRKRTEDPMFQHKAVETARIAEKLGDIYQCPYMIENPVSVLSSMWRRPDHIFNPYEYGGYLPESDSHPVFPEYIEPRDAYPKKTCLWTGNGFVMPERRPVAVSDGYSKQHSKLGGKSSKTKLIRSLTPRGFAEAVFKANHPELIKRRSNA